MENRFGLGKKAIEKVNFEAESLRCLRDTDVEINCEVERYC